MPSGILGECAQIYFTKYTKTEVNGTHATIRDYNFSGSKCEDDPVEEKVVELNACTARADGAASNWTLQTFDAWRVRIYMEPGCTGRRTVEGLQPLGFCRRASTHQSSQKLCHDGKLLQYEYRTTANCSGPAKEAGADIFLNGSCWEWQDVWVGHLTNISLRNWGVGGSCPSPPPPPPPAPPPPPPQGFSPGAAVVLRVLLLALCAAALLYLVLVVRRSRRQHALAAQSGQLQLEELR